MKSKKGLLISIFSLIAMLACLMCLASCGGTGCLHSFGEWSTISTPSCTQDGERERCCEKCGTTETEKISALGHSYVLEVANDKTMKSPANEIDAAVYYKSCACGSVSENDTFEYGGNLNHTHSFTEEKIKAEALETPATCNSQALYFKSCECGVISTSIDDTFRAGELLNHKDENNDHMCDSCESTLSSHSYVLDKCEVCGKEKKDCNHGELFQRSIDLAYFGACEGTIYYQACDCGEIATSYYSELYCPYKENVQEETIDGTLHTLTKKVCLICGVTVVEDVWTVSISDCVERRYTKATIYKESSCENVIIECTDSVDDENHNYEYTYELEEGKTCDDGLRRYQTCLVCDDSDWEYVNEHANEYVEVDLTQFGVCYSYISYNECERCGCISNYYASSRDCYLNSTQSEEKTDENGNVHYIDSNYCNTCGATFVTESWWEPKTSCVFNGYTAHIIRKDDVDVFEIVESYNFDDHDYESTYYFEGDDCNDGYLVVDSCTRCDKTIEWRATGHDREGVSHFFEKMGLCGGSAYEEVCTLCHKTLSVNVHDYHCSWSSVSKTDDGLQTFECEKCGTTKTVLAEIGEKNEWCEIYYTEQITYIVNGEKVYSYTSKDTKVEHIYNEKHELLGETCVDGVTISAECEACGEYSETTVYYHYEFVVYELPENIDCCDKHFFTEKKCLCGKEHSISFNDRIYAPDNGDVTCPDCALVITLSKVNEEDEYAWYTIFNYVITFDGEEIYSTTERSVYPK